MHVWPLLLLVGALFHQCQGKTFYCPNSYNYGLIDLHAEGVTVDTRTSITFQTKGNNDAHILLQRSRSDFHNNIIEIVLGGWGNSQSVIRNRQQGSHLSTYRGRVLSSGSYNWFWISWGSGCVQVGKGSSVGSSRIMNACSVTSVVTGMRISYGFGSTGYFNFVTNCPTPGDISYGSRSYSGTSDGSTVTYSCNAGYTITSGSSSRTCSGGSWSGSQPTCGDVNECASNPCQNGGNCNNLQNSYSCTCTGGWTGTNCQQDVNECASNPCRNGGRCTNGQNRFTCSCASGWTGTTCQTDVNECASNPCQNGGNCNNLQNSYSCTCAGGWTGTNCQEDINECASSPCQNGGQCTNGQNRFTCSCPSGWTGTTCQTDVNECASNPCQNGATCHNGRDSYTCTCAGGWTGTNCDQDINECDSNPCQNGATCNNLVNQYTCTCTSGWQGIDCDEDVDECASGPCQNGATCNNGRDNYTCTCVAGWTSTNCDVDIDECASNPCFNGATCNDLLDQYTCDCAGGWQGYDCDQDIDECLSSPCVNGTCTNLQNAYKCTCFPDYTARNCDYLIGSPMDGNWGQWEAWQGCSVTCGTGRQRRYRACDDPPPDYGGLPCAGDSYEENTCSGGASCPVAVNGNWGAWSSLTSCSVTCGTGFTTRVRLCNSPSPSNGGDTCTGDSVVVSQCTESACPVSSPSNGSSYGASYQNICPVGYFTCNSGVITCIMEVFRCDCTPDCDDLSDENLQWAGCETFCSSASDLQNSWVLTVSLLGLAQLVFNLFVRT